MATLAQLSLHPATIRQVDALDVRAEVAHQARFPAWGIRGVEVQRYLDAGHTLDDVTQLCERHGLKISDAGALNDWQWTSHPPLVNRVAPPGRADEAALWAAVERFFALCATLGVAIVVAVGAGKESGEMDDAVEGLRAICLRAARWNLRVAYEVLGTGARLRTYGEGWDLVRRTGCSNAGLLLDVFHFYCGGSGLDLLDRIPTDRIFLVRLSDAPSGPREALSGADRLMPGEGAIPLTDIVCALEAGGYRGYYSVEVVNPAYQSLPALEVARRALTCGAAVLGIDPGASP